MELLIDLTMKATVVLAAACVVAALQRRGSAAARHLTLSCALAGLLILPAAVLVMPAWRVPAPSAWTDAVPAPETAETRAAGGDNDRHVAAAGGALALASPEELRQDFDERFGAGAGDAVQPASAPPVSGINATGVGTAEVGTK